MHSQSVVQDLATKVCPLVLRAGKHATGWEILAFAHPSAGLQLVKGGIQSGESEAAAALRELAEESGLHALRSTHIAHWTSGHEGQIWAMRHCQMHTSALPDTWRHATLDDHGHVFQFFWHPLNDMPGSAWHPVFQRALAFTRMWAASALRV